MRFLDTNQIGFDAKCLGFPSVGSCQAIVYQTDIGLFGFHASSSPLASHKKKCDAFALYVQGRSIAHAGPTGAAKGKCVIGIITQDQRFGGFDDGKGPWCDELIAVADSLGFTGTIYGAQIKDNVSTTDSTYVRFDWSAWFRCTVKYKRWSKMGYGATGVSVADPERRNLTMSAPPTPLNPTGDFTDAAPGTDEQTVRRLGTTNEGSLHTITWLTTLR